MRGPVASRSLRDRLLIALAPALLVVTACLQILRVETTDQVPWKGGGFGMFATIDRELSRFARVYVETPSGPEAVELPEAFRPDGELRSRFTRARVDPHGPAGDRFAEALAGELPGESGTLEIWAVDGSRSDGGEEFIVRPRLVRTWHIG